ncbi:IS3 family transposase [Streptomyces sp. MBT65]|uniref:IS3 family transposase n=1 Tax=Streptomyces sp. MBT65 TaxID=1488395 RepID=UPI00190AF15D|nr:IS3 family transposase [Streptomyces sp. MBT65]
MLIRTECIRGRVFATRAEVNLALFEYIDGFYNSPAHPETARLPQSSRVRGEALRRPGTGQTNEPETPSTRPDQLISTSRTPGEPHFINVGFP